MLFFVCIFKNLLAENHKNGSTSQQKPNTEVWHDTIRVTLGCMRAVSSGVPARHDRTDGAAVPRLRCAVPPLYYW